MDSEEKDLLKKSVELAEENNKILRYIRSSIRLSSIMRIIYWVFIIGSAVGAYYFVQPYLDEVTSIFNGAKSNLNNFGQIFQDLNK